MEVVNYMIEKAKRSEKPEVKHEVKPEEKPEEKTEKRMYAAKCTKCHEDCKVPFEPKPGKDVLCKKCFDEKKSINA